MSICVMFCSSMIRFSSGFLLVFVFLSVGYATDPTQTSADAFNEGLAKLVHQMESNKTLMESANHQAHSVSGSVFKHFPCERFSRSSSRPTSVHQLRPGDIDVVAAIGDSYTAAKAAGGRGLSSLLHDYRGLSWSAGGDGTFQTLHSLPNILKEYNPDIYGFSNSIGSYMSNQAGFNVAVSGATSDNLAFQAALLIQRLKNDPMIDMENDWKLITILIGGNDICRSCHSNFTPHTYYMHLNSVLDMLKASIPRAFINFVELMPVELARYLPKGTVCDHLLNYYCQCAVFPKTETDYHQIIQERREFQKITEDIISSGKYDTSEDFTVVLQPFYRNSAVPKKPGTDDIDYSLFAVDCFHYSAKGHSLAGLALWNNMLQPLHNKTTSWIITEEILCPSDSHPFLATSKNSEDSNVSDNLKSYRWTPVESIVSSNPEQEVVTDTNDDSQVLQKLARTKLANNKIPTEQDNEKMKQALTIVVIGTVAVVLLIILVGVLYYGIGLIRRMDHRSPYQEI